jgi:hypothetical protein
VVRLKQKGDLIPLSPPQRPAGLCTTERHLFFAGAKAVKPPTRGLGRLNQQPATTIPPAKSTPLAPVPQEQEGYRSCSTTVAISPRRDLHSMDSLRHRFHLSPRCITQIAAGILETWRKIRARLAPRDGYFFSWPLSPSALIRVYQWFQNSSKRSRELNCLVPWTAAARCRFVVGSLLPNHAV